MPLDTAGPNVGDLAPDFTLESADGRSVRLQDLRGRPLALVFYRGGW